jgi:hypothetical protein
MLVAVRCGPLADVGSKEDGVRRGEARRGEIGLVGLAGGD